MARTNAPTKRRRPPRRQTLILTTAALLAANCGFNANDPRAALPIASPESPPSPISGGTLRVTSDGRFAVVSDPDRDAVFVVDLSSDAVRRVPLSPRDEPGRAVVDGRGTVHIVLRGAGALVSIEPESGSILARRAVCEEPRGVEYDGTTDRLWVACARGTLLALPARGTEGIRRVQIAPDARDVALSRDGTLWVSRFRSASITVLDRDGRVVGARSIADSHLVDGRDHARSYRPAVLWRMRPSPHGMALAHQFAFIGPEQEPAVDARRYSYSREQQGWRDPCDNSVAPASVRLVTDEFSQRFRMPMISRGVLPVDVAVSAQGQVAVALAGELGRRRAHGPQVVLSSARALAEAATSATQCIPEDRVRRYDGQVVAVDFAGESLLVQTREPAVLYVGDRVVPLASDTRRDTGHEFFHGDLGGGIACASCHPEGADDGHVWNFLATGPLRTPVLHALRAEGPFHRRGDVPTLRALLDETMSARMSGPSLDDAQLAATQRWLTRIRPPVVAPEDTSVARGRAVFHRSDTGCVRCHSGPNGSDGQTHLLRGQRWLTPSLQGLSLRAPYLHDGCAPTIEASLLDCDQAGQHGDLRQLTPLEFIDLVAFLRSL